MFRITKAVCLDLESVIQGFIVDAFVYQIPVSH